MNALRATGGIERYPTVQSLEEISASVELSLREIDLLARVGLDIEQEDAWRLTGEAHGSDELPVAEADRLLSADDPVHPEEDLAGGHRRAIGWPSFLPRSSARITTTFGGAAAAASASGTVQRPKRATT